MVFDYDAGLQGFNLYIYCGNNPVNRIDISGADSSPIDDDVEDILEAKTLDGGGNPGPMPGPSAVITNPIDAAYRHSYDLSQASNSSSFGSAIQTNGYTTYGQVGGEKTEIHHIVEQCQQAKSGFSASDIQSASNKIAIPYSVHRLISGYYSSKREYTEGLRVRDWLAGQSFAQQTAFGWQILDMYMRK